VRSEPCLVEMTESGAASASQLMAAIESRELVGAVRPFAPPNCAETSASHHRARTEG
jgi:hypothetical protein